MTDTIQGPAGKRGQIWVRRVRPFHYEFMVNLGGRTWTTPEKSRTRFVGRAAARRLIATPNRANRRAINTLNRKATA